MSMMEAVEMLAASGFKPRQTIYLAFGQDEELSGERGAMQIAALLKQRGVHLQFVLDEGLLVLQGVIAGPRQAGRLRRRGRKGLRQRAADGDRRRRPLVDSADAGRPVGDRHVERRADPPRQQPMPASLDRLARQTFETIAPEMSGVSRVFLSNLWLFGPLVELQLQKSAEHQRGAAYDDRADRRRGRQREQRAAGRATAIVNFRLLPGDTSDNVMAHVQRVVANPRSGSRSSGHGALARGAAPTRRATA